jgi:hypothetical protein
MLEHWCNLTVCVAQTMILGALGYLLAFHTYLLCRNLTTIESLYTPEEKQRFHKGSVYRNWTFTMGGNPLRWVLPLN